MLNQVNKINGYKLNSLDGEIGKVKEFYFDDYYWTIRYLVADTGNWLTERQVLISPHALTAVNKDARDISVNLTKKQIMDSPPLDSNKPVSRQFEETYYGYYSWPMYWAGPEIWGAYPYVPHIDEKPPKAPEGEKQWDSNLRSTRAVTGYTIQAVDGEIGHVDDFIIDDATWEIRYLIVDTGNWWPGKRILISPRWIKHISWSEATVSVNLSLAAIKQSPEYSESSPLSREYEAELHRHYNYNGYWVDEPVAGKA
jgi:uncharacterized protein YrrD